MKKLNHACKNSCSGWNEGFKEGEYSVLQQHESMSGKLEIAIEALKFYSENDIGTIDFNFTDNGKIALKALKDIGNLKDNKEKNK